jgi:hypothetical protein
MCLDWREICDGKIDCIGDNSGIDEKYCEEMDKHATSFFVWGEIKVYESYLMVLFLFVMNTFKFILVHVIYLTICTHIYKIKIKKE